MCEVCACVGDVVHSSVIFHIFCEHVMHRQLSLRCLYNVCLSICMSAFLFVCLSCRLYLVFFSMSRLDIGIARILSGVHFLQKKS